MFIISFIFIYYNSIFYAYSVKINSVIYYMKMKEHLKNASLGIAVGVVNGIFGAGGGMLAVPILKKSGLDQKTAHANAVAVILPITVVSTVFYLVNNNVNITDGLVFIPTGIIGSLTATFLLKKFSNKLLQKIFAVFMIYAGVRLLLR